MRSFLFAALHLPLGCFHMALGHGQMTFPPSTRMFGSIQKAGTCYFGECMFFSHKVEIPGEPTVNKEDFRTFNVKVSSGPEDWTQKHPWRAPGTAPVFGSGCSIAGGSPVRDIEALAVAPLWPGLPQGLDAVKLPAREPQIWRKGSVEEVGWAITANHGGGYSYRLCPKNGNISEACFQRNVLRFAADKHWIQYGNLSVGMNSVLQVPRFEVPMVKVTEGTHPAGSEWARNPIPGCKLCDTYKTCGSEASAGKHTNCTQVCAGDGLQVCPPGMTQFPEPLGGLSGFTPNPKMVVPEKANVVIPNAVFPWSGFPFSIIDKVHVPEDLSAGDYLLSWRWDSENSPQVWQNCADIRLVDTKTRSEEALFP